jgi:hypothetical protein
MATKHLIYTTGLTLYGSDLEGSDSTATSAITEDGTYSGLYPGDTDFPYVYIQSGGSPDPSSDTLAVDLSDLYYGTVDAGDLFHAVRIHAWDWNNASLEDKVKALYHAQQLIDRFAFVGSKTDDDQTLEFPRTRTLDDGTVCLIGGSAGIPTSIEQAAFLIADALLGGRDPQADFEALNVKVETFGPVRTEFDTSRSAKNHVANLIPSPSAWALIRPFLAVSSAFSQKKG